MTSQTHATTKPSTGNKSMQAIEFDDYSTADVLHLAERPLPQRKNDELLFEV